MSSSSSNSSGMELDIGDDPLLDNPLLPEEQAWIDDMRDFHLPELLKCPTGVLDVEAIKRLALDEANLFGTTHRTFHAVKNWLQVQTFDSPLFQKNRRQIIELFGWTQIPPLSMNENSIIMDGCGDASYYQLWHLLPPHARHFNYKCLNDSSPYIDAELQHWVPLFTNPLWNREFLYRALMDYLVEEEHTITPLRLLPLLAKTLCLVERKDFVDDQVLSIFQLLGFAPYPALLQSLRDENEAELLFAHRHASHLAIQAGREFEARQPHVRTMDQSVEFAKQEDMIHDAIERRMLYFYWGLGCTAPNIRAAVSVAFYTHACGVEYFGLTL